MDIRELRRPLRNSQQELAARIGVGRCRLYSIEHGYAALTAEEERRLRQALLEIARQRSLDLHAQLQRSET
jgi:transcriptional regulator with XRE-family HTH domain